MKTKNPDLERYSKSGCYFFGLQIHFDGLNTLRLILHFPKLTGEMKVCGLSESRWSD